RVVQVTGAEAVLEMTPEAVPVPRRLLETVFRRPFRWSIVPRPRDARNVPSGWGDRYVVCPVCSARAPMKGHPADLACPKCHGVFGMASDERDLAPSANAGAPPLAPPSANQRACPYPSEGARRSVER